MKAKLASVAFTQSSGESNCYLMVNGECKKKKYRVEGVKLQ